MVRWSESDARRRFAWLTVNALFWLVTTVHFSLTLLHGRRLRWLTCALVGVSLLVSVLTLPLIAGAALILCANWLSIRSESRRAAKIHAAGTQPDRHESMQSESASGSQPPRDFSDPC